jgi:hypothetical protein
MRIWLYEMDGNRQIGNDECGGKQQSWQRSGDLEWWGPLQNRGNCVWFQLKCISHASCSVHTAANSTAAYSSSTPLLHSRHCQSHLDLNHLIMMHVSFPATPFNFHRLGLAWELRLRTLLLANLFYFTDIFFTTYDCGLQSHRWWDFRRQNGVIISKLYFPIW